MSVKTKKISLWAFSLLMAVAIAFVFIFANAAVVVKASDEELFPDSGFENGNAGWTSNGGSAIVSTDIVHSGDKALKVSEFWARYNIRGNTQSPNEIYTVLQQGVQEGTLYRMSMWTRSVNEGTTTLGAGFTFTGQTEEGWSYPRLNFFGGMYCYGYKTEWVLRSSIFGIVKNNDKLIFFVDGASENTAISSFANIDFDLGSNNGGTYFDDVSVVKTSYTANAVITLKDGNGVVSGKQLIIKDANGTALSEQPQISENNGVYTVKDLTFNTLNDSYKFAVDGIDGISDGIITAINRKVEMRLSSYTATVTVKDEEGLPITDAEITAVSSGKDVPVTNEENGTYTISDLYSAVDIKVVKEGLIEKQTRLTAENSHVELTLVPEKPATVVNGNLIANGNFEEALASGTQEPGKWNTEGGSLEKTTNYQEDGKYSLKIKGNSAYRVDLGQIKLDGTKYLLSFSSMSETNSTILVDVRATVSSGGGYAYPQERIVQEVKLSQSFNKYEAEFSILFDEIEKTVVYEVNGQKSKVYTNVASFAAIDFVFGSAGGAYLDNISLLTAYDIEFVVLDGGKPVTEGLVFDIVGSDGKKIEKTPEYSDGSWKLKNVSGSIRLTVKYGEYTYPVTVFDSRNKTATIENGFKLTVKLVDGNNMPVKGAQIVARKGATDLFEMTDNGDGTYTYEGASGTFSLYITLDGYVFPVERNVNYEKTDITITATSYPDSDSSGETSDSSDSSEDGESGCADGCDSSLGGLSYLICLGLIGIAVINVCKKIKN